ncbi:DUF5063 domain-containing protein [Roseateles cellulosilyticus]|uniref:DUF5063 domain-containing protein n=1 Tax=Pelomonas cellulosilytica TaxID=2906762 RepID=A0ABS8Y1K3_9BURK|nr:DUF5063 domain-containing protein [Pelomonas sp. P8]
MKANLSQFSGLYYREVFDPDPQLNDEVVIGDVADDLLDIYLDLRRGLLTFERGEDQKALWHWSFSHRIHWGRHCVGALMGLHGMVLSKQE